MKYFNHLDRKYLRGNKHLGEYTAATAMFPDKLTFRWWQLFCAVSVGNIVLWSLATWGLPWESDVYRPVRSLRCGLRLSINTSEGRFGADLPLGLAAVFGYCG